MTDLVRVTVNLTPKSEEAMNRAAEAQAGTKTDAINKALQMWDYVLDVQGRGGALYVREAGCTELERLRFW